MKQLNHFIFQALMILMMGISSSCQSQSTFEGVYAGVKLSLNPLGGGMNRTDVVILFRKDKTFTDELEKADWKTAVRGRYVISGKNVQLLYSNGDKDEFDITSGGNLDAGTYVLFKMDLDNSVPKGSYKFKFVSGSGGIATGTTYIGSSTNKTLDFDGAGNFITNRQSATVVAGDNIGGGTNSKSDGEGKYMLKDGVLTLKYADGKTTTHSFFASAGDAKNKAMAVIDGSFYFMEDEKEAKAKQRKNASEESIVNTENSALPSASALMEGLRKKYGGTAIDAIRTYKVQADMGAIKLVSYNDLANGRFRNEMYQQGKLLMVEQIDAKGGWQWVNGKRTPSTRQRIQETRYNDYVGILGLQKSRNKAFTTGQVKAVKNGYQVTFQIDGNTFGYLIDKEDNIVADSYKIGTISQTKAYSDHKNIGGILVPFKTTATDGKNKVSIVYRSMEVNVPLETDWKVM